MEDCIQKLMRIWRGAGHFFIGDIIRNTDPYEGESSYRVEKIENEEYLCSASPDFDTFCLMTIRFDTIDNYALV